MIRKLFLLGLPLILLTTQQIQAEERDPVLEQLEATARNKMEKDNQKYHIYEYIQNDQFTPNGKAALMNFMKSYMYIIEHNAAKVPDAYKLNGLDPLEDGRSVPDPRSGLAGIDYRVGPFMGDVTNRDPLRFRTDWSYASIRLNQNYQQVPFTLTSQELSSMGLIFEKVNVITSIYSKEPSNRRYVYIYHSRSNPDLKVSFTIKYTRYPNNHPPAILPQFDSIMISKGDFIQPGLEFYSTAMPR